MPSVQQGVQVADQVCDFSFFQILFGSYLVLGLGFVGTLVVGALEDFSETYQFLLTDEVDGCSHDFYVV